MTSQLDAVGTLRARTENPITSQKLTHSAEPISGQPIHILWGDKVILVEVVGLDTDGILRVKDPSGAALQSKV